MKRLSLNTHRAGKISFSSARKSGSSKQVQENVVHLAILRGTHVPLIVNFLVEQMKHVMER